MGLLRRAVTEPPGEHAEAEQERRQALVGDPHRFDQMPLDSLADHDLPGPRFHVDLAGVLPERLQEERVHDPDLGEVALRGRPRAAPLDGTGASAPARGEGLVDEVHHSIASRHGRRDPGPRPALELEGRPLVRGVGHDHRHLVPHPEDGSRLEATEQVLRHGADEAEVDDVVLEVHQGHAQALRERPVELLLGDRAHLQEDLPEAPARPRLDLERFPEVGGADQAPFEEDVPEPSGAGHPGRSSREVTRGALRGPGARSRPARGPRRAW